MQWSAFALWMPLTSSLVNATPLLVSLPCDVGDSNAEISGHSGSRSTRGSTVADQSSVCFEQLIAADGKTAKPVERRLTAIETDRSDRLRQRVCSCMHKGSHIKALKVCVSGPLFCHSLAWSGLRIRLARHSPQHQRSNNLYVCIYTYIYGWLYIYALWSYYLVQVWGFLEVIIWSKLGFWKLFSGPSLCF